MSEEVAVIGAGMAGAAFARSVADAGFSVRVFDKGRSVGGRLAQRRVDAGVFDHGAQYLSARDGDFVAQTALWRRQGLIADWHGASGSMGHSVMIGVPAMNAPIKSLLDTLPLHTGFKVTAISHGRGGWRLWGDDGERQGPFSALALAIPAPQAVELLASDTAAFTGGMISRLGAVRMAPCWSALAAFSAPLAVQTPALRFEGSLAWAARNGSKPGRGAGEAWTLHAGPAWSVERLAKNPEEIAPVLVAAFATALGRDLPEPIYLAAHRWRYALVERALGQPCIWDDALRLGLCGDWCLGPRVEAAWLSGRGLAAALAKGGTAS